MHSCSGVRQTLFSVAKLGYGLLQDVTYPKMNSTLAKPKFSQNNTILRIQMWHVCPQIVPR